MKKLLNDISKLKVAVVGDAILDHYVWGRVSRISPEAPVAIVDVAKDTWFAGGGANVAMNVSGLGANSSLFGATGADEASANLSNMLLDGDVNFTRFTASANAPTIMKTRIVAAGQQILRVDRSGSPEQYEPSLGYIKSMLESLKSFDLVIISDYARGFLNDNILHSIIETARSFKKIVVVDPKPRGKLNFSGANLITVNRAEAFELAAITDSGYSQLPIKELAEEIYRRYSSDHLVVTLGEQGMYICKKSKPIKHIPTLARDVFDPTGAGDAVTSAISLALAAGQELESAAQFANVAAGIVVGKLGSTSVTAEEILRFTSKK